MSTLSDRLRAGAVALREADGQPPDRQAEGTVLASIPSGPGHVLRVIYQEAAARSGPRLSIRVWREHGRDRYSPMRDIGLEIPYYRVAAIAEAIAEALDLMERNVTLHQGRDRR